MAKRPNAGKAGGRSGGKAVASGAGAAVPETPATNRPALDTAIESGAANPPQHLSTIIDDLKAQLAESIGERARLEADASLQKIGLAARDQRIAVLEAELAATRKAKEALRQKLEAEIREIQHELDSTAAALAAAQVEGARHHELLDGNSRQVEALEAALTLTEKRVGDLETSLARTTDLQRSLEAEFDQVRCQLELTTATLTAAKAGLAEQQALLAARETDVQRLRAEAARRGPPGTPAAVGRALADLFRSAQERRLNRIAVNEPWRVPPNLRR